MELLKQPLPWYIAGPLIGLMVPALLIMGNKSFGLSSSYGIFVPYVYLQKFPFLSMTGRKKPGIYFLQEV